MTDTRLDRRPPLLLRLAIVLLGVVVVWGSVIALGTALFGGRPTVGARVFTAVSVGCLAVALVVAARRWLDRRPFSGLALPVSRAAWRPFLVGLLAFSAPSLVGLGVAVAAGWMTVTTLAPGPEVFGMLALVVVTVFVYEAVPEELVFRGYVFRNLAAAMPPWLAVVAQAVLFTVLGTALWVVGEGWEVFTERVGIFFAMGIVLGLIRIVSRSVWACVGFHLGFQVVAQTLTGDTVSISGPYVLAVILPAFVVGTPIVALLTRGLPNWSEVEPDPR
ncbi:CPBP family intramembrane glutamic endopeptidase [Microbacterium sp. RU33B]|uniref:CPBP family intramembrane glutamic endopeptidase n=1 Tax=Microbacterium sp. RU33B TaxID=1907390 RepID=UPI00096258FE|nr:type II CAAX endopeptidase family protein [Microbacterium sp. RU33B]SIT69110.1 hypothetical protein SAMN05880545_0475 [Microbacterium sp. RU33B]